MTISAEEFAKYDKGETHSDKGLRSDKGKLSALPDISPVSENDLPRKIVVRTQKVYVQPKQPTFGQIIKEEAKHVVAEAAIDMINDPRKRAVVVSKVKKFWRDYIKPSFASEKEDRPLNQTKAEQLLAQSQQQTEVAYQVETVNENNERIVVTGEQAEQLVATMRQKAKELYAMIYLLSNITAKDEKTDSEYILEDAYIKQLLSEEATSTMKTLVAHRQLLDEGTAICFEDWLNGHVRNGDQRIPIPIRIEGSQSNIHEKHMEVRSDLARHASKDGH